MGRANSRPWICRGPQSSRRQPALTGLATSAPLHLTEYGVTCRVRPTHQAKDLALSNAGDSLPPHTDGSYRWGERLVQFLYAHSNDASGGDLVLVDGFRVAQDFRRLHPSRVRSVGLHPGPVPAVRPAGRVSLQALYAHCWSSTPPGEVEAVCYCPKNMDWQLPFDQVDEYYRAYRLFSRFLNDPQVPAPVPAGTGRLPDIPELQGPPQP